MFRFLLFIFVLAVSVYFCFTVLGVLWAKFKEVKEEKNETYFKSWNEFWKQNKE